MAKLDSAIFVLFAESSAVKSTAESRVNAIILIAESTRLNPLIPLYQAIAIML